MSQKKLQSMDQAALRIQLRRKAEEGCHNGPCSPADSRNWERDWEIRNRVDRRGRRGGMTMRPGDGLTNL